MSFLGKVFSAAGGGLVKTVGGLVDDLHLSGEEKQDFKLKFETLLQQRDSAIEQTIRAELNAKMQVVRAELLQGDTYTKRARPTVIYFGLLVIFFNYCLVPLVQTFMGTELQPFALPTEFWFAWGGIVSTYAIGRSAEKRGARGRVVTAVTGGSANKVEELLK